MRARWHRPKWYASALFPFCVRSRASGRARRLQGRDGRWRGTTNSMAPIFTGWIHPNGFWRLAGNGWGNDENSSTTLTPIAECLPAQDGNLVINVLAEKFTGARRSKPEITLPARLKTQGKFSQHMGASKRVSRFLAARGYGPLSGCWATTLRKQVGPPVAKSTSWKTLARSPHSFTGRFTGRDIPEPAASEGRTRFRRCAGCGRLSHLRGGVGAQSDPLLCR